MLAPRKQPRGTCPSCGRDVALRDNGLLRTHRESLLSSKTCDGSGGEARIGSTYRDDDEHTAAHR